jgi:Cu(I)/Ag(I) efflux system protein CusF
MKCIATLSLGLFVSVTGTVWAQPGNMKDMPMDAKTHGAMQGMELKDMDAKGQSPSGKGEVHTATAVVKSVDPTKGIVTLSHEPIKSLNWPAMTMGFSVKDNALFDKLSPGKKVQVELVQQGAAYVVTSVK